MVNILIIVLLLLSVFQILIFSKLFVYTKKLENKVVDMKEYVENLTNSVKNVIHESYLKPDGRLVKNFLTKNIAPQIYNGENLIKTEQEIEL